MGGPGMPGGMGGFGGRGFGPPRGPRMRRGDVRGLLLDTLSEAPGHGYDLISRLEARSQGRWRPSPGSVYPTLQLLEEEGLVTSEQLDGKKVYALSEAGRAVVADRAASAGRPDDPWGGAEPGPGGELQNAVGQLLGAAWQAGQSGDAALVSAATQIVHDARRRLYELLAQA